MGVWHHVFRLYFDTLPRERPNVETPGEQERPRCEYTHRHILHDCSSAQNTQSTDICRLEPLNTPRTRSEGFTSTEEPVRR